MWDLPGPGLEPVSPALAGGFLATAPPGQSGFLELFGITFHFADFSITDNYVCYSQPPRIRLIDVDIFISIIQNTF